MDLHECAHLIKSKQDFLAFISALRTDLDQNRDHWENATLETFLAAMEAWIVDMDSYYTNSGQSSVGPPTWKTFADILMGARLYE